MTTARNHRTALAHGCAEWLDHAWGRIKRGRHPRNGCIALPRLPARRRQRQLPGLGVLGRSRELGQRAGAGARGQAASRGRAQASSFAAVRAVAGLPGALAARCEYSRRASVPAFPPSDVGYRQVWTAASRALAENDTATATVITDSLEGSEVVASPCRVTVVSGCPLTRRNARRHSFAAVPRPPSAKHLPSASFLVLDARRPDDLVLAGGF